MKRWRIEVTGHVQGVGFRPHVKRLARQWSLAGWTRNTGGAVELEVQGDSSACIGFVNELISGAPRPARIHLLDIKAMKIKRAEKVFTVLDSREKSDAQRFIPVDIGLCEDCRSELLDKSDRRHDYAFINCCQCGPRYTIIEDLPYDRERTSMRGFPVCLDCGFEYTNELDRRFHAEPNACAECGPKYTFTHSRSSIMSGSALSLTISALTDGKIVAIKGIGGFHLVCLANNSEAIDRMRLIKSRPHKPLGVMVADLNQASVVAKVDRHEAGLLSAPDRPIVLLQSRSSDLAPNISPGLSTIGLMLPYAPIHVQLFKELEEPLVMTSANKKGEPIIIGNEEVFCELESEIDACLHHDRSIVNGCDDSVVRRAAGQILTLRSGRGKAPKAVKLVGKYDPILACGADLKNTVCLAANGWAHVSQYLGDLAGVGCLERYKDTIERLGRLLDIEPKTVVCDAHPDYVSSLHAAGLGLQVQQVQHHHAHIVAALAEKGIDEPVIGVAFDGSGWGADGHIWGGEWLICDRRHMERRAHFKETVMPGSEAAVTHPWRMALSYLVGIGLDRHEIIDLFAHVDEWELELAYKQIVAGINTPTTSSCGRLFEAIASLVLGSCSQTYEGQVASQLETVAAAANESGSYRFSLSEKADGLDVGYESMFAGLLSDKRVGVDTGTMAARFHNGLADVIRVVSERLRDERGINKVVLGGGVFVNAYLLTRAVEALETSGFQVITSEEVPLNDGGISLGQAAVVAAGGGLYKSEI